VAAAEKGVGAARRAHGTEVSMAGEAGGEKRWRQAFGKRRRYVRRNEEVRSRRGRVVA